MIFISAGHHERAQGAKFEGRTEYEFAVKYADELTELLDERCIRVPNGTLKEKVTFINNYIEENPSKSHIAVEIHFNSAKIWRDQNANGVIDDSEMIHVGEGSETLYYPGSKTGEKAAATVQSSLGRVCKPDRGIKEGWYQFNKAKGPNFFLAKTKCRALIIEPEFIDNLNAILGKHTEICASIAESLLEVING